jgi:hypothetical protein
VVAQRDEQIPLEAPALGWSVEQNHSMPSGIESEVAFEGWSPKLPA